MDFTGQISNLFRPPTRPHPPTAELSVREGRCGTPRDFHWLDVNVPCQKACPAGTDVPAYLTALSAGRPEEAYRINLRDNVFPAVLGRVCSRPCESACRHGYEGLGEPVAICFSKRSAADFGTQAPVLLEPWFEPSGKRVAVIGSGVAGLTAARNLTLFGHAVTVFEKHSKPGGMLNQGIPEFRLPRDLIDREIRQITDLGIEIRCNSPVGPDLPLEGLLRQFDATVMATGTLKPSLPDLPGSTLEGIRHGLDFLREVNATGRSPIGRNVIVIGGGYTAMDCARTAQRLGAETAQWDLKVLYRRSQAHMRVTPGELEALETEQIPLECHAEPVAYLEVDGRLGGMRFRQAETGREFDVPADTVLLATGQRPDFAWADDPEKLGEPELADRLFAAGDCAQGASSLIDAIAHAKRIAEHVDHFLTGTVRVQKSVRVETAASTGRTTDLDRIPRQAMPALPADGRDLAREVETGYDRDTAQAEAARCYRCNYKFEIDQDKCIKCDWCLKARPRPECILMLKEIRRDEEGRVVSWEAVDTMREMNLIWINQDECIRCGACIKACPVDAINLQEVSLCIEPSIAQTASIPEEQS